MEENRKIEKLAEKISKDRRSEILILPDPMGPGNSGLQNRIIIKDAGKIRIIPLDTIIYIEAFDYYARIHLKEGSFLARIPLKSLSQKLPADRFIRIHRSSMVNLAHVKEIKRGIQGEYLVMLASGSELKVSESFKKDLLERFK
jgi:two-component system LytT family response regulator